MTSEVDRRVLLQLARRAIERHVAGTPDPAVEERPAVLDRRGALFVTIHRRGELRGCIGHLEPQDPYGRVIAECAVAAGTRDPRFPPVTAAELPELELELSLLGSFERIHGPAEIQTGRHGLMVEDGWRRGLLLPQVATEWNWDAETFLAHTCRKAGLAPHAWKHGATMWRFEAEVFSEQGAQRREVP